MSKIKSKTCRYVVSITLNNDKTYYSKDYTGYFWTEDLTLANSWRGKLGLTKADNIQSRFCHMSSNLYIYIETGNNQYSVNQQEISSIKARELVLSVI